MKKLLLVLCLAMMQTVSAQNFELDKFKEFKEKHKNLTGDGLMDLFPAGKFLSKAPTDFTSACYSREIDSVFALTAYEKELIAKHGFMVTERNEFESFGMAYDFIFRNDLPVYVSSDAILHALHMSYDDILQGLEKDIIIPKLRHILDTMRQELPALEEKYALQPEMRQMLLDLDVYLTVPFTLLMGNDQETFFAANADLVNGILSLIASEKPADIALFGSTPRTFDFSQFTPRGHYSPGGRTGADSTLSRYFKTMIWFGKTEMMLNAPQNVTPVPSQADIKRQTVLSVLLSELVSQANTRQEIDAIDLIIESLIGEQDNITLANLQSLIAEGKILSAADLLDETKLSEFQNVLKTKGFSFQRINSQILMGNSTESEIVPPAAFLLFGQRFVVDSYIFANLVNDKVRNRMLPSSLDILFTFGNDASAQLLQKDMNVFKTYPPNAAALRYLVDAYDESFWTQSFYNGWLNSIRTLNPPKEREKLPRFMQTAAWWQKSMNTQLSSWTQLRHDNLLYAKQSYSGGNMCLFPESFVEPVPEFYHSIGKLAEGAVEKFKDIEGQGYAADRIFSYFKNLSRTMDTLEMLSQKELSHIPFNANERKFLRTMIRLEDVGCERLYNGWFPRLFYAGHSALVKPDRIVADVHTAPTDEYGTTVGWVKHVGTGPVNLAVIVTEDANGQPIAFAGAALSFYENTSTNFTRYTDGNWSESVLATSHRSGFVDLYLADKEGNSRILGEVQSLQTVQEETSVQDFKNNPMKMNIYPNPVESSTTISFAIPPALAQQSVSLKITNLDGSFFQTLVEEKLPEGHFSVRWESDAKGISAGGYFVELQIGDKRFTQKIMLTGK